jgi:hypothetical protein
MAEKLFYPLSYINFIFENALPFNFKNLIGKMLNNETIGSGCHRGYYLKKVLASGALTCKLETWCPIRAGFNVAWQTGYFESTRTQEPKS